MPRGGARSNSGPKPGAPQMRKLIADPKAMQQVAEEIQRPRGAKRCKDILAEFAVLCAGIASRYQPQVPESGPLVWAPGHKKDFIKFAELSALFASKGAPFQDPTYRQIEVMGQIGITDERPVGETIDLVADNVTSIADPTKSMRVYRSMLKTG